MNNTSFKYYLYINSLLMIFDIMFNFRLVCHGWLADQ